MTAKPFPVDATMTAITIGYKNPSANLIHARVLPSVTVGSERFTYHTFDVGEWFTLPEVQVGRKGQVGQVEFSAKRESGEVFDYGLDDAIPSTDISEAKRMRENRVSMYDPEGVAVEGLTHLIQLHREKRASTLIQDAANYDTGRKTTLSGTSQFSDFEHSDPFGVIDDGMRKPLVYRANTIVMGEVVWETIKKHPKLLKAVKGNLADEGAITRRQFAELMEIDPADFLVGVSMVNAAAKGQAVNLVKVWGNFVACLYIDRGKSSAEDQNMTWGFTAELGGRTAGAIEDPDIGIHGGRRVRVAEQVREVVCAKSLGYLIKDPIGS